MKNQELCNKIILPCCSSYDSARQIFNRSIQKCPYGILYCESEGDVADGIHFARECGLTVRIRSGTHNYEGFCVGNGVLVLDTSRLKNRDICEETGTVCISSGVNNEELYEFLGKYGYPFPSGTCPTVGAAGLTQGGGWGHSARIFGLACDSLLEAEIVDAGGNLIAASQDCHPDLFWAIRGGGGGNFGVVTSLKYCLPPKVSGVTYVDIRFTQISEKKAFQFFNAWQRWLSEGDTRFTPNSRIFNSAEEGTGIYLRGFFYGTPDEGKRSTRPFLEIAGAQSSFEYVTFLQATQIDASFYPQTERFRFAGRFVREEFSQNQIENILRLVRTRAEGSTFASVALYALGGKVGDTEACETAFFYRNANYIIGIETVWENPSAEPLNLTWILPRFKYLQSITDGSYINFPYCCTDQYMKAYYGGNAGRLVCVKRNYDPGNLFCFPQSIPLA
ncbi:MAG: FAD-dependent oxidoreductase [Lachnospiraceae bacterium]